MKALLIGTALLGVLTAGCCATIGSLRPGQGSSFEVRERDYDAIWKAAVTVVGRSLTIVEDSKEAGYIKAEARAGFTTWGEVVGVFITPARKGESRYTVEVVSRKRSRVQITGQDWGPTVTAGIKAELGY